MKNEVENRMRTFLVLVAEEEAPPSFGSGDIPSSPGSLSSMSESPGLWRKQKDVKIVEMKNQDMYL